jgi:hypothetical protein
VPCIAAQGSRSLAVSILVGLRFGLHANYTGTQLEFAVSQLTTNKHINLVTLSIGGNDLLLLEQQCSAPGVPSFSACVSGLLPGVLQSYAANLTAILAILRANYNGTVVLVTSYSPSANPLFLQAIGALDFVMTRVGINFGVKFADGFTAFQIASAPFNGDPCAAGLLIRLTATTCDVDPSPARGLLGRSAVTRERPKVRDTGINVTEDEEVGFRLTRLIFPCQLRAITD